MREELVIVILSLPFFWDLKHGKEDKSRGMKRKRIQTRSMLGILAEKIMRNGILPKERGSGVNVAPI